MLREIKEEEVQSVFSLILKRIEWMDQNNIQQWNVTDYTEVYPISYYEEKRKNGELFGLIEDGKVISAAVLLDEDERWNDSEPALYIHNFVSQTGIKGAGKRFLQEVEDYARTQGKKYLRLDSSRENEALAHYYESFGFKEAGTCTDGPYQGICRQKEIKKESQR